MAEEISDYIQQITKEGNNHEDDELCKRITKKNIETEDQFDIIGQLYVVNPFSKKKASNFARRKSKV